MNHRRLGCNPDADELCAVCADIHRTVWTSGYTEAIARFNTVVFGVPGPPAGPAIPEFAARGDS